MAESKRVKAEEAENIDPLKTAEIENTEVTAPVVQEEEVGVEEPLELYSVADDQLYMTSAGEFNWDAYEAAGGYNEAERKRFDEIYEQTLSTIAEKEVVEGIVVNVGKKEVVVNIGYKSEGVIPVTEFRYNPDLKPGDRVPVYVEQQEDKNGQLNVSHKTARLFSAWSNVNRALESGEIIKGDVKCRTKGGLIVDVFGIEAFLPGSQIDVKPIRDYDVYVGKVMELKVVKINNEFKNVVVSHKALIEAELEEQKKQIMSGLEKGQVLEGVVKNITTYGVFVDLGGVDGLIHITDLSWGRINHPEEVVQLDEKINVVILDFDDEKKRIALGLKQLQAHPWDALQDQLQVGQKVKGKVVVLADYGAFVEIAPGVEGLIHVSEMSWSSHLRTAGDFMKVGDEVECIVLNVDKDERKLSLGMKQLTQDPWEGIDAKFPEGSRHKAKVRAFTNFGVFCELSEGVDGLIHISDLSWSKKIKHPSEFCAIGDEIEVVVLELDKENRRISLGHKQIEENPWDVFESVFTEGSVHQGTIIKKDGNHSIVTLPYGLEGYCMNKNLKKEDGSTAKVEETLNFLILEFNKNQRKITVSHTATWKEDEAPAAADPKKARAPRKQGEGDSSSAVKAVNAQVEKSTLGDLDVLANLKEKMEGNKPTDEQNNG
jgi:small subunit ribosomal protein S1